MGFEWGTAISRPADAQGAPPGAATGQSGTDNPIATLLPNEQDLPGFTRTIPAAELNSMQANQPSYVPGTAEVNGKTVRPKVIASTATIRKAGDQVHATFLRRVNVFPPHGLDVQDNFFAVQRKPSEELPGRRYIGIYAPGRRLKVALIRVYVALLSASQTLYEKKGYGKDADPWMTLIGYFNSMRELGGMRRLVDDDVTTRANKMDRRGLGKRKLYPENLAELTSRMRSEDIPQTLDRLEAGFDPELVSQRQAAYQRKDWKSAPKKPLDVLLATNMISVGVDVQRQLVPRGVGT